MTQKVTPYGKPIKYRDTADAILGEQTTSDWLKDVITDLDQRDPIDALKDVAMLLRLQKMRVDEAVTAAVDPNS